MELLTQVTDHVERADNTASMPEVEKGEALEGFNAAAGASQPAAQPTKQVLVIVYVMQLAYGVDFMKGELYRLDSLQDRNHMSS